MTTSSVPAVIDYLVTTFKASLLLGAADPPVSVFDGLVLTAKSPQRAIWVGLENVLDAKGSLSAESEQEWVAVGSRQRNEHVTIFCSIGVWNGNDTVSSIRNKAFSILATIEDIVRADASLGRTVLFVNPGVTGIQYKQMQSSDGPLAQINFKIVSLARIGG